MQHFGVVHELFNPMPGRFKDYIALPKANMYQSLHTTLIGPKGIPFEVQLRTWDMHRIAEYGIAAHWAYKEANKSKRTTVKVEEDKLSWLRETLEWQKDMQDPQEFLNTLKTELFEDEVYVFTRNGDIRVLPKGATPIDFAYNIHTDIGHKMTGAKINSKMMPIITKLNNGDIIEIITTEGAKGPSRDWLKFVKSSSARNKIMQWFKKEDREENIEKGKDLLQKEIKRIGMHEEQLYKQEYIDAAIDRYKFGDINDMYASVGFGAVSAGKIISKLLYEYRKDHDEENIEEKIEELVAKKKVPEKNVKSGVIVKGIDNCLVKFSKCCNPLPGDEIIGYITRGRGVSVHRKDCMNIKDLFQEEERIIDVEWSGEEKTRYKADIELRSNDRSGLVADIAREMNDLKADMLLINSRVIQDRIVVTEMTIEVESLDALNKVLKALRKIDSVYEVSRKK